MNSQSHIHFGDTTITYEVRRSERRKKTVQITVNGSGVQVLAPANTPDLELQAIVRKRAPWILSHSTESMLEAAPRRYVNGETLPYLGRNVRMIVSAADVRSPQIRFDHWRFRVEVPRDLTEEDRAERIGRSFVKWYRTRAAQRLPERVEHWRSLVKTDIQPRVLIRDQRLRWASCAPDGTLRFNWRVVMVQPALIDYIVVHELAHLTIKNHSIDFWRLVSEAMPDAQNRRRRLKEAGKYLPL